MKHSMLPDETDKKFHFHEKTMEITKKS